ncbi:MAG: hypothetical protein ABSA49_14540 [Rhizomicrobium sp.]|jgi:uncharacterized protein YdeI (BOF family)
MKTTLLNLSLILTLASAGAAFAQDQTQMQGPAAGAPQHGAFKAACGADLQTFCASAQTKDDRHACVKANKDKFSDSCKAFMASRKQGSGPSGQ